MTNNFYNQTISQLFEAQVLHTPDKLAVVFSEQQLTYRQLNEQANQLAHYIRNIYQELKPDTLITLCLERSVDMIIAILATLKAGAAYVPIDPKAPPERIKRILEDTNTVLLLTQIKLINTLAPLAKIQLLALDAKPYANEPKHNPVSATGPGDLAYIIYTSGTTGLPKGVMQMHVNVLRLFAVTQDYFRFNSDDVWILYHSYSFDFSVWELWGALFYGGMLLIPSDDDVRDMHRFYNLCMQHKVSILNQTPSAFQLFAQHAILDTTKVLALRFIIFGGEMLHQSKLLDWWQVMGVECPKLVNMYGITETTVHVTLKELAMDETRSVIGKPLADLKAYVLDEQGELAATGAIGELFISGAGLARGYLNQPELTQERFIANKFAGELDKKRGYDRLYKTGDLVRCIEDGELEYIGRNDSQVKIRGYRIELGEIEHALLSHPLIQQAVVLVRQGAVPCLVAYFVARRKLGDAVVRLFLTERLPAYMLPSILVQVRRFPLTSNGKLNRNALPESALQ